MIYVNSINIHPSSLTLKVGSWHYGMVAQVLPDDATNSEITWYSSDTSVASVNTSTGNVYGVGVGTAKIYAAATDGSGVKGYCTVTVADETVCEPLVAANADLENIDAHSINTAAYSTNAAGIVPVTSIAVNPSCMTVKRGRGEFLHATVYPSNATYPCLFWTTSNPGVAKVNDETGYVQGLFPGTVTIYAKATDGSGIVGSATVVVAEKVYVNKIIVGTACVELNKGDKKILSAKILPADADNKSFVWSSSRPSVASVDSSGIVTANSGGTALIYATAQDGSGVRDYCTVTVKQPAINPDEDKGEQKVEGSTFADPVDVYSGAHILKNTLMTLFGGQGLSLTAHYDSTRLSCGVLGKGWYHNYEKHLELSNTEARVYSSPSVYAKYISNDDCTVYTCTAANKTRYVLTVDCENEYPYIIDCDSDHTEYYNSDGSLVKIVDHQGFETLISYSDNITTITDTVSGKKIYLEKDATCKICRVYDDASRQATLTYDGELLTDICDVNGNSLSFTYNEDGQVLTGTDSKGTCYFTNTYDEYGRVSTQKDAIPGSIASTFTYEDDGKRITTDRNGHQSTRVFDSNGLLVSHTDENGNTRSYAYDTRFNVLQETDANGKSVTRYFGNINKPLESTDRNGHKTYMNYDNRGNIVKIRYPKVDGVAPEETFVYNNRNQLTQHTDLRGTVTVYTYDAAGMPASKKVGSKNAILYTYRNGLLVSQTDATGHTTQYGYNAIGQMTSMTDAHNNTTLYEYDACGNLLKVTDPNGKSVVNTYDGNNQKTSVTDANGNRTEYSYNGNMKNDMVTLPDGNTILYEFDGEDRQTKITDQAKYVTTTQYDKAGRAIFKYLPDVGIIQYEYDKVGNVVKEINPTGAVTTKTYDGMGNVTSVADNDGNITRYQYNGMSKVIRTVNAASGATVYKYSKAGDLLSETDALGNKKTYTYDAFGNKLTATDAKGNVTTYTYDENNNLLSVRDPLGNTTTYNYNCLNQLVSVKDAKNNIVRYGYDGLGRRTTVTDAKNNVFTTVYDANGNVLKTIDANGNTVKETAYNSLNLPFTVTDAAGMTTTYTYNEIGKVKTVTDSMNRRQEYAYNTRGMNTSVRDANNSYSSAEYDTLGNITKLTGPLGGAIDYTYDEMGRLITETTSSGGIITYGYNELSIKEQLTNARGQNTRYFYDACGRITGFVSAEDSVSYTYDANGNVLTATDSNGTIRREYDSLNRVTRYTDTFGNAICYEYDAVGNLTRLVYPDNTSVTYAYDANNNLVSVTDWANRVTTYTYDSNNRVIGITKPDGSVTTNAYDNKQRLVSSMDVAASGYIIAGFEYEYDELGRISTESNLAKNTKMCYTYDNLSRVTKRTVKNISGDTILSEESYSYDAAGNITDAPDTCYMYDTNNRLTVFNGNSIEYDMDGNMLSDGKLKFEYDSANRLIKAGEHKYTYNAEDTRIRNFREGIDVIYTYNTNCKLSQLIMKATNSVVTKFVYGVGLIGEEKEGEFRTYHFDYRGSTVALTDINGQVTDTFEYDTYGKIINRTGINSVFLTFGYNGRDGVVSDSNGLNYMRARYYSPQLRRFLNADILHGDISDSTSLNRYSFVNGNPVSFVDPFGLSKDEDRGNEKNNSNVKSYYAIYVVDYDIGPGLPIVGHSRLYFLCDDGNIVLTEYTGNFPDKSTAKIYIDSPEQSLDSLKDDLSRVNDSLKSMYLNGVDYVLLKGDFTDSLNYARELKESSDYPGYNLITNSCLTYTNSLLDKAKIDGKAQQFYVKHDNYQIVPRLHIKNMQKAQMLDYTVDAIKQMVKKFTSNYSISYKYFTC